MDLFEMYEEKVRPSCMPVETKNEQADEMWGNTDDEKANETQTVDIEKVKEMLMKDESFIATIKADLANKDEQEMNDGD